MTNWHPTNAKQLYNMDSWSNGYFTISDKGTVVATPNPHLPTQIDLSELAQQLQQMGLSLPVLVRFSDVLSQRVQELQQAFANAIEECQYQGDYHCVYPIKTNQQKHVVEVLTSAETLGLEAGSKPELLAILGLNHQKPRTIICNGYKDEEYIRLALIGQQLGHRVFIIVEQLNELDIAIEEAKQMNVTPRLGFRARLSSLGKGKWQNTGGEKAKFGLTATQILQAIATLEQHGQLHALKLLHFHMGSQIANVRDFQYGLREAAWFYSQLHELGAKIEVIDVGGGLGVDYDGTRSRNNCSVNYTIKEYAHNVIHIFHDICQQNNLPHPDVITESGRALTAHHAVLITNIIDIEKAQQTETLSSPEANEPQILHDLWDILQQLDQRSAVETYHDVCYLYAESQALFSRGLLTLQQRSFAEQSYVSVCQQVQATLNLRNKAQQEIHDEINNKLADKIFCNLSIFQSAPDIWAIQQIFPIVPLSQLDKAPTQHALLKDITCDSDGRIDYYVHQDGINNTLLLPTYNRKNPYHLGIFLVGAYQEILGDMHNLFGDTDSVHVELTANGQYTLNHILKGDTVKEVLEYVHFETQHLIMSYQQQLQHRDLDNKTRQQYLNELTAGLSGYTYLEEI